MSDDKRFYMSVIYQLECSQDAYKDYNRTKNFLNAKVIYSINQSLLNFINGNASLIKNEDYEGFKKLTIHFLGWITQFDYEVSNRDLKMDSEFVFVKTEGRLDFPVEFVDRIKKKFHND